MKITVLCENTALNPHLISEHGLSIYIETETHKILFDMGQTDAFASNAEALGVDLAAVDFAILSHGHYDHGGGLKKFLEINKTAPIYLSEHSFGDHYNASGKYIGLDKSLKNRDRLVFVNDGKIISDFLEIITAPAKSLPYPIENHGLTTLRDGIIIKEDFRHEQFLMIHENQKKYLFSGCAHTGVLNLSKMFLPDVFVGGFHFSKLDTNKDKHKLESAASLLEELNIQFYTCHCTGVEQFEAMKETMGEKLSYISCGFSDII